MTILSRSLLCDGLAIWNLRREHLDVYLELVLESPFHNIDMLLALTAQNGLFQLLGILYNHGRVLC